MKILIITTIAGTPWGGSEILWSKIAKHYLNEGHEVVASVYDWGELPDALKELTEKGLKIHKRKRTHFTNISGKIKGKFREKTSSILEYKSLLNLNPTFVFFSQGAAFDLSHPLYYNYISKLKAPFFCYLSLNTEYEVLPLHLLIKQREVFAKAKHIFFVSDRNRETAKRQICSDIQNSSVINNPLTFSDLSPLPMPDPEIINFAMVARLDAFVKGHPVVLKILSEERWKNRKWKLNIYGVGSDKEYIEELIQFYKLTDRVFMKGQINNIKEDIWKYNHVLLMPSQYEGCPISLYDAAICERTAVVSDVGGNAEFVKDGFNGFVSEAPSVKSFGSAMEKFWNEKEKLIDLSIRARESVFSKLNLTPHKEVIETIQKIIVG